MAEDNGVSVHYIVAVYAAPEDDEVLVGDTRDADEKARDQKPKSLPPVPSASSRPPPSNDAPPPTARPSEPAAAAPTPSESATGWYDVTTATKRPRKV